MAHYKLVRCLSSLKLPGTNLGTFIKQSTNKASFTGSKSISLTFPIRTCRLCSNEALAPPIENNKELTSKILPLDPEYVELGKDIDVIRKIQIILMEAAMGKESGLRVPEKISTEQMAHLLTLRGHFARQSYMKYLFLKELHPILDKERKERKRKLRLELLEKKKETEGESHIVYGISHNSILVMVREKSLNKFYSLRESKSVQFGIPLVFDLSYEEFMIPMENINCADQLKEAWAVNKIHREPFHLHFTSANPEQNLMKNFQKFVPTVYSNRCMITTTEKSYLDIFPHQKVVYLSPDAPSTLEKFDPDAVYIIGGLVDKRDDAPLSMAKAKRERIAYARLPIEKYVLWGPHARKALTLNQMMMIMLEWKDGADWTTILTKCIPKRKLVPYEDAKEMVEKRNKRIEDKMEKIRLREERIDAYKSRNIRILKGKNFFDDMDSSFRSSSKSKYQRKDSDFQRQSFERQDHEKSPNFQRPDYKKSPNFQMSNVKSSDFRKSDTEDRTFDYKQSDPSKQKSPTKMRNNVKDLFKNFKT